jgi:hypothetical protein
LIKEEIDALMQGQQDILLNSVVIDFFLWDYAKAHAQELASYPIHYTRSVFY